MAFSLAPRQPFPRPGEDIVPRVGVRGGNLPLHACSARTATGRLSVSGGDVPPPLPRRPPASARSRRSSTPTQLITSQMVDTLLERSSATYRSSPMLGVLTPRPRAEVIMALDPSVATTTTSQLALFPPRALEKAAPVEADDCTFCGGRDPYGKGPDFLEKLSLDDQQYCHIPTIVPPTNVGIATPLTTRPLSKSESPRFGTRPLSARLVRESQQRGKWRAPVESKIDSLSLKIIAKSAGTHRPSLYGTPPCTTAILPPPSPRAPQLAIFQSNSFTSTPAAHHHHHHPYHHTRRSTSPLMSDSLSGDDFASTYNYSRPASPMGGTINARRKELASAAASLRGGSGGGYQSPLGGTLSGQTPPSRPFSSLSSTAHHSHHVPRVGGGSGKGKRGSMKVVYSNRHTHVPQPPRRSSLLV